MPSHSGNRRNHEETTSGRIRKDTRPFAIATAVCARRGASALRGSHDGLRTDQQEGTANGQNRHGPAGACRFRLAVHRTPETSILKLAVLSVNAWTDQITVQAFLYESE